MHDDFQPQEQDFHRPARFRNGRLGNTSLLSVRPDRYLGLAAFINTADFGGNSVAWHQAADHIYRKSAHPVDVGGFY